MDIVLYEGPHLDVTALQKLARSTAELFNAEGIDLDVHTCKTKAALFDTVLELVAGEMRSKERAFLFRTAQGIQLLRVSQILYFKSSGHKITTLLTDGRELRGPALQGSISSVLEPLIQSGQFYRTYRSTFVNKTHIARLRPEWVELDNGTRLSVSRKYYRLLLEQDKLVEMYQGGEDSRP